MILPGQAEVKAMKSGYTNYFENILEIFKHQHRISGDPLYPGSVTEARGVSLLRRRAFYGRAPSAAGFTGMFSPTPSTLRSAQRIWPRPRSNMPVQSPFS
jgi:hypothetical protein